MNTNPSNEDLGASDSLSDARRASGKQVGKPISTSVPNGGVLTLEDFEAAVENMRYDAEHPQPHYSMLPEWAVDEYLKQGVIPRFVIVSSRSMGRIRAYIKAHPEVDTQVNDLLTEDSKPSAGHSEAQS